ncbi:MAG: chromophore lyase CpcT/CpeT [Phycisphaeraceae bacterium]|nr:chromophore lyase CpcT/CpeT [Phycisphaeraceae bacterium]
MLWPRSGLDSPNTLNARAGSVRAFFCTDARSPRLARADAIGETAGMMTTARTGRVMMLLGLLLGALALGACSSNNAARSGPGLEALATWMTGGFSNARQAQEDPANYKPVVLHIVPIWGDNPQASGSGGVWLYVEQSMADMQQQPYRQRVHHLTALRSGEIRCDVYTLPEPAFAFAGAWDEPTPLDALAPTDLTLSPGCSVVLSRAGDGAFEGGTTGTGCASSIGGSAYATTQIRVTPGEIVSWDRGFDASGRQVWGATAGAYVFTRVSPR